MKPIVTKCSTCKGTGKRDDKHVPVCNVCLGHGEWLQWEKCVVEVLTFIIDRLFPQITTVHRPHAKKEAVYGIVLFIRLLILSQKENSPDEFYDGMEDL